MPETQVQPEQVEEREPWDYQPEGGGEQGGSEEGGQLEQTSPPPASEGGRGEGGVAPAFAPWIEILIEIGMLLLKKAQDQGLVQPGQIKEITERHGLMP
jgi:hypothetical protein